MMHGKNGFTLIELLVVVSLIAILAVLATPSFAYILNERKLDAAADEIVYKLNEARLRAVVEHKKIRVCITDQKQNCDLEQPTDITVRLDKTIASSTSTNLIVFNKNGSIEQVPPHLSLTRNSQQRCIAFNFLAQAKSSKEACV